MTLKMPKQGLFEGPTKLTPAGHRYLVEIERLAASLAANESTATALQTALDSLSNNVDGFPAFGTLASENHVVLETQAEYDALSPPVAGTFYFVEE